MQNKATALTARLVSILNRFPLLPQDAEAQPYGVFNNFELFAQPMDPWGYRDIYARAHVAATHVFGAGFRTVGAGYFSMVFEHDDAPGVVFKISPRASDAYSAYALWVRDRGDKHAPQFYEITAGNGFIVYAIKRYISLGDAVARGLLPPQFNAYRVLDRACTLEPNSLYRRELIRLVHNIRQFFRNVATIDIHGDNLMFDTDTGRVIVTDPVSFTKRE